MSTSSTSASDRLSSAAECLEAIMSYHGDIDRGRATHGISRFADDATFQARGEMNIGRDAILTFLRNREANTKRHTLHLVANPVTTFDGDDDLSISAVVVLHVMDDTGHYVLDNVLDTTHRFTRSDRGWLIVERTSSLLHPRAEPNTKEPS